MILTVLIYIIAKKHFDSVDLKFLVSEHFYMPCDREFGIIEKRKKDARPWFRRARSPDLAALDFFLRGYVKSLVYETPVDTEDDLRARILAACDNVRTKPGLYQRIRQNLVRRCHACIKDGGRNFEHLL
ncbi:hypothetical protein ANN_11811 [Periplaneta americana]|uniref:Uncharacterized protein n=1 Tax=Periplaneta americana TaxID=6978 RepID=A0ABQ8T7X0_PERAM|nr:hypothetical protein ANN_11811 [Periplaneta americana]